MGEDKRRKKNQNKKKKKRKKNIFVKLELKSKKLIFFIKSQILVKVNIFKVFKINHKVRITQSVLKFLSKKCQKLKFSPAIKKFREK